MQTSVNLESDVGSFDYQWYIYLPQNITTYGLGEKAQKMSSSLFVGALMLREVAPATNFPISLFPHKAFTG